MGGTDTVPGAGRDDGREARLRKIREDARRLAAGADAPAARAPLPRASTSTGYYGLPLLKKPTWTWEIPVYFFVGGAAGAAALIGAIARLTRRNDHLARDARWIAASGGVLSGALLISDLGRPERFIYMLRVFKPQSPMSVGAWIVAAFSSAAGAAAAADAVRMVTGGRVRAGGVGTAADALAAVFGLGMCTYTGVLIGATAIPVWNRHVHVLPIHFGASALASAVALLELRGHRDPALRQLGLAAAAVETALAAHLEAAADDASRPLRQGASGLLARAGGLLSGPLPFLLRLGRRPSRRHTAAAWLALGGALVTRAAWIRAGVASSADPSVPLQLEAQS